MIDFEIGSETSSASPPLTTTTTQFTLIIQVLMATIPILGQRLGFQFPNADTIGSIEIAILSLFLLVFVNLR